MQREQIKNVLKKVEHGELSADDALDLIRLQPYKELSFANVDTARSLRNGVGEVIYGEGKTAAQIVSIASALFENGQKTVLVTRIDGEKELALEKNLPLPNMMKRRVLLFSVKFRHRTDAAKSQLFVQARAICIVQTRRR